MTNPISPGALRAANELLGTVITKRRIETVAKLIDESTGLPALLEALKEILASAHPNPEHHPAMSKAWLKGRAILAKSEGTI